MRGDDDDGDNNYDDNLNNENDDGDDDEEEEEMTMSYLIFVIFLHEQNFWRIRFTPKKRVKYSKIHSKLPIFCVITAKYTVYCQIFALNLKQFTPAKKNLHEYIRGVRDKYEA